MYLKAAKFEEKVRNKDGARTMYERALSELGHVALDEPLFLAFTRFEIKCKSFDRAQVLFKYALDKIPKHKARRLYEEFMVFQKQHGSISEIEEVVIAKRRRYYEEELLREPHDYDLWFDYTRLEEETGDIERTREVYERAIENIPPAMEKQYWNRYM